ncbi:minichromosome maintenance protein 2 [Fonticula alba]|uniref:DNA replication licensing factor MCM2 n=1 Tax=Fonticula alba TaxID=691883 RepID=A0A058ZAH1_FONAL|nr:minichromosome maintenance protein 2 [Fonticula alba]KCV71384.1 minichromosome maintenance protein 2 [Fonticula alba]|eukprot:XP_009494507.1 minichromosome maintenance protein 2 [Fonticula alba]
MSNPNRPRRTDWHVSSDAAEAPTSFGSFNSEPTSPGSTVPFTDAPTSPMGGGFFSDAPSDFFHQDHSPVADVDDNDGVVLEDAVPEVDYGAPAHGDDLEDEEDDGEDLLGDDMEQDYRVNPELDKYEGRGIDDTNYGEMDIGQRRLADAENRKRARDRRRADRLAAGLGDDAFNEDGLGEDDGDFDSDDPDAEGFHERELRRRRIEDDSMATAHRAMQVQAGFDEEEAMKDVSLDNLDDMRGYAPREWVQLQATRNAIRKAFQAFISSYLDEFATSVYAHRIKEMCNANRESFDVSWQHLYHKSPVLAQFLGLAPTEMLAIFDEVALEFTLTMFPHYHQIHPEVHVRISDVPVIDKLRDLRHNQLNHLVRVSGVVTRRTNVLPQLRYVKFDCAKCTAVLGPYYQSGDGDEITIARCPECESKGPFTVNMEQTAYRNFQKITIQESPGTVPAGRLPRHKDVILLRDLIDSARPGDEVEVIGIYRNNFDAALHARNGFPVFQTIIEANNVIRRMDHLMAYNLTDEDRRQIRQLAQDERIGDRIAKSIAPGIFGHENIKQALALSLFGGVEKNVDGKHRIRGDINVLMLGDPGTAKSQFLKYVERTSHRAVYATGQGASAVGLTAAVQKDPVTREWTLQGGALVLADRGVCLIDEFDKMNDADRTSIHEAMEQQSISISKAGIVTSLNARCAVIAAANPIKGKYDSSLPFGQNVDLTEPILSRFDILCVVRDTVDPVLDGKLARFVVDSHLRYHPEFVAGTDEVDSFQLNADGTVSSVSAAGVDEDLLDNETLRKYIMFARQNVRPRLRSADEDRIAHLYAALRRESAHTDSIPVTVRLIESIIRMSEARARMFLRDVVRSDDVNVAIRMCVESFVSAQKHSVGRQMRRAFARFLSFGYESTELLAFLLSSAIREEYSFQQHRLAGADVSVLELRAEDFESKAREYDIHDLRDFYASKSFAAQNCEYDAERQLIIVKL